MVEARVQYRELGDSGLTVSEISLGSWLTYGVGVERDEAEACVHRALDLGITFIDTANVYGLGTAESFLGEVLAGVDRSSYVLATKLFFPMSDEDRGLSAAQVRRQLDASLRRLRTDHVDLYQCHRYDPDTPLEETMGALTDAVRAGKVRALGFSEWSPAQIEASFALDDSERFTSSQPMYNMLWRKPEGKVFPCCAELGVGQVVFSPLAQGVLTGKYLPGEPPPEDSRAASEEMNAFIGFVMTDEILAAVQRLRPIADEAGLTMAQLALAWVLRDERVSSAIIGASRPEQVDENVAASGRKLGDDVLVAVDEVLSDVIWR